MYKKIVSFMLALGMVLSMGVCAFATNDLSLSTTVNYTNPVSEAEWTWAVPSTITFTNSANKNIQGSTANVSVTHYIATSGKKLEITITSSQAFTIANGSKVLEYKVTTEQVPNETAYADITGLAADETILVVAADKSDAYLAANALQGLYFTLGDTSAKVAGDYTGTITFCAAEVAEIPE